jgi:hypothetical protein
MLFTKGNFPPVGKNESRFTHPEFEELYLKMATMENSPERMKLAMRMNDILIEECPIILNFNKAFYVVLQPWAPLAHLNMILPGEFLGGLRYLPIDVEAREKARREWNPVPKWPIVVGILLVIAAIVYAVQLNRRRVA